mmetsp:Transcript_2239/g.2876  ORF Transcript_2239/g.2876 Transcript_2239/m.2876 type:complete len:348 (+) Transcript_2239:94-1137(+)|eukprot:CAMPEP_0172497404 /NCGR_PEP_ID=MMETSP1066-20121228/99382_1 /TAXON_ID=671091 /ORGANISM="Coscinodiscus wailesii, Strain CCMP2513" /LENGTH=347 /DNA_ID=CAMNT_0013270153 /DNA_START=86 /DNA_END=1129 /DNA_ORIENTATION=+
MTTTRVDPQQGPHDTRDETISDLDSLLSGAGNTQLCRVYGTGPLLLSNIPASCQEKNATVNMGIDEAGRGPLLGPMVYSAAYWSSSPSPTPELEKLFKDSKVLTPATRSSLFDKIKSSADIGFVVRVLHASEISRNMFRANPYNVNEMSHDAVIQMIRSVLDAGVSIGSCFVDTVGNPETYRQKLERTFGSIHFVVEKKADAKYPTCSAASVIAKVTRDEMIENWKWNEEGLTNITKDFGSGYPSDPKCKKWLENNFVDHIFGYPDIVRFSWGPAKVAVKEKGSCVEWEADVDDDEDDKSKVRDRNQMTMSSFFCAGDDGGEKRRKRRKYRFFERMGMEPVTNLVKT